MPLTGARHIPSAKTIADFTDDPTDAYTNAVYFHSYTGISRANIVIGRLAEAPIEEAAKNDIEGQAKFIRALNYFKLVRHFGEVPLYLKEVTKASEAFLPRASVNDVYTQIIADAQDAISKLSGPAAFPQTGQATKGAATMLLAEVYMTRKEYAQAEALLKTLESMGYKLLADYAAVFSPPIRTARSPFSKCSISKALRAASKAISSTSSFPEQKHSAYNRCSYEQHHHRRMEHTYPEYDRCLRARRQTQRSIYRRSRRNL